MKFLTLLAVVLAVYGTTESKPAVEANLNDATDEILEKLKTDAVALGIADLPIPDISVKVGSGSTGTEIALSNVKVTNLELMVRDGDVVADFPSLTAGVTANIKTELDFRKPVEVTADAAIRAQGVPAVGTIDATVIGLAGHVASTVTLVDDSTFTVNTDKWELEDSSVDVKMNLPDLDEEVLSAIATELAGVLESQLNEVVAVSLKDITNAQLSGESFSLNV